MLIPEGGNGLQYLEGIVEEMKRLIPSNQGQSICCLVVIMTAPPVRIFLLLRVGALVQIAMLSMGVVFPLIVVDGLLRAATRD